jgi:hypothetical protein
VEGLGRLFGVPPRIEDGIRGDGLVLQSVGGLDTESAETVRVGSFRAWETGIPMLVSLPGQEPYHADPKLWMTRAKYPIAGTTLPVTVERGDPSRLRIEWDEVPKIDEWIEAGHPVFTDPDSVHAHLLEALDTYEKSVTRTVAEQAAAALGPSSPVSPDLVPQLFERMRSGVDAWKNPQPPNDRPTARVLAASPAGGQNTLYGEVLLSVAVPGSRRYGARWRGLMRPRKPLVEWSDIPVAVDVDKLEKVEILWDGIPDVLAVVTQNLRQAGDQLEAQLAAGRQDPASAYEGLLSTIPDPDRRALVREQISQALQGGGPGAAAGWTASAPAVPAALRADPLDQLKRLGELRDSGALTEAEFAAEKARLLEQM